MITDGTCHRAGRSRKVMAVDERTAAIGPDERVLAIESILGGRRSMSFRMPDGGGFVLKRSENDYLLFIIGKDSAKCPSAHIDAGGSVSGNDLVKSQVDNFLLSEISASRENHYERLRDAIRQMAGCSYGKWCDLRLGVHFSVAIRSRAAGYDVSFYRAPGPGRNTVFLQVSLDQECKVIHDGEDHSKSFLLSLLAYTLVLHFDRPQTGSESSETIAALEEVLTAHPRQRLWSGHKRLLLAAGRKAVRLAA